MYMRARERLSNLNFAPEVSMSNFCASFIWFALVSLFDLSKGLFIWKVRTLRYTAASERLAFSRCRVNLFRAKQFYGEMVFLFYAKSFKRFYDEKGTRADSFQILPV